MDIKNQNKNTCEQNSINQNETLNQSNRTKNNDTKITNICVNENKITNQNSKAQKKENIKMFIKFGLLSISAGIIQSVSFSLLTFLTSFPYWPCYLISLILSIVWNFTLNRKFTFKGTNNIAIAMLKIFLFYLIFTPLSTVGGQALTNIGSPEFLVFGLTMISNFILEFLYCKFVVYRNKNK